MHQKVLLVESGAYNVSRKQFMRTYIVIFQRKQMSATRKLPKETAQAHLDIKLGSILCIISAAI